MRFARLSLLGAAFPLAKGLSAGMTRSMNEVNRALADIDNHMQPIARHYARGSDLNVIASAIHNLVVCVEDVIEHGNDR
jgi:hypothetical protein